MLEYLRWISAPSQYPLFPYIWFLTLWGRDYLWKSKIKPFQCFWGMMVLLVEIVIFYRITRKCFRYPGIGGGGVMVRLTGARTNTTVPRCPVSHPRPCGLAPSCFESPALSSPSTEKGTGSRNSVPFGPASPHQGTWSFCSSVQSIPKLSPVQSLPPSSYFSLCFQVWSGQHCACCIQTHIWSLPKLVPGPYTWSCARPHLELCSCYGEKTRANGQTNSKRVLPRWVFVKL